MQVTYRNYFLLIAVVVVAGCTQFNPGTDANSNDCPDACADGSECINGSCVPTHDILADVLDTATSDLPDAVDDARDVVPEVTPDIDAIDDTTPDAPDDTGDDMIDVHDTVDIIEVSQEPTVGKLCLLDRDCRNGLCVAMVSEGDRARRICTGPCGHACPAGTRCMSYAAGEDGNLTRCEPFPNGLCYPCDKASDCVVTGAQCLAMPGGGSFCTTPCEGADSHCPVGFSCQVLNDETILPEHRAQCLPLSGGCDCAVELAQAEFPCSISNSSGICQGTMTCYPEVGWTACPAPIPSSELCDGKDNDCNGFTDEGFRFTDWDGRILNLGQSCGTGICEDGTVVCLGTTAATCSTAYLAAPEDSCGIGSGNGRDDDCNGSTDEGCVVHDADGDGFLPEEGDCNDNDAGFHPGAPERCCPPAINADQNEALKLCDSNCNGLTTVCDANDLDLDGYSNPSLIPSMRDCDDADPTIHPGAPDVCDDGKDNDCSGDGDLHCCNSSSPQPCVGPFDTDADGYVGAMDCNDQNPNINPGMPEICDGVDNDCDGITDDGNPGGMAQDPESTGGQLISVEGGSVCGTDEGECQAGRWVCVHYSTGVTRLECLGGKVALDEICDGLDNNCDGSTDETFPGRGESCDSDDTDRCENGVLTCNIDGTGLDCVEPFNLTDIPEVCPNGIDDDCDGSTDTGCVPDDLDGDGYRSPADCDDTRAEIRPWANEPCCDPTLSKEASIALCDWDCNGLTARCNPVDFDFDGFFDINEGGTDCNDSDPQIYPGAPEKCGDGIDQDCYAGDPLCSEVVDADNDGYSPPADCNDNNGFVYPWVEETCNDVDDDCDGVTDEGNPGTSDQVVCGSSIGICRPGVEVCVHFDKAPPAIMCIPQVSPQKEVCDGQDNNCNGSTDEYFRDLGQRCDGPDSDLCKNGRIQCTEDRTNTECGPELMTNLVEVCDGLDNDCDGLTDEDFTYEGLNLGATCDGYGVCGAGAVVCSVDGVRATCSTNWDGPQSQATPEVCDGLDNDCDAVTDNGMRWYGLELESLCRGIGECGIGHVECNPVTLKAVCSVNPDGSTPRNTRERCDGLDNDCDGHTDNKLVSTEWDCMRKGVCNGMIIPAECVQAQWVCDYSVIPDFQAGEEHICDTKDNNCDGVTDEGFETGGACDGPDYDKCKNGVLSCKADGTGVECGVETIQNIVEICNALDDDCDGRTDEDFPVGELCDGPDSDFCKNGSNVCAPDKYGVVCGNEWITNITETCNSIDDDCDGQTDEGFGVGVPCDGPDEDQCALGRMVCNQAHNGVECYEDGAGHPTDETCNGVDDNCDGSTDEGFNYGGEYIGGPCEGVGECGAGTVVCNPLGTAGTCSTNADGTASQAVAEMCDHLDNNCDGSTDEGLKWGGIALGQPCVSTGACAGGTVVCSPSDKVATCSTMPNGTEPGSTTEKCDGVDNDCDGYTDEDLAEDISTCRTAGICLPSLVDATCVGGGWACDYSRVPGYDPAPETKCDAIDNNCDGTTDETWPRGASCDGGDADMCKDGLFICKQDQTGVECFEPFPVRVEACGDNVDNDCDGLTDEEGSTGCVWYFFSNDGDAYGVGTSRCLCVSGQITGYTALVADDCNDNEPLIYPTARERCNLKDDDCDGQTDEDPVYTGLGGPCDSSDADTCANGIYVCSEDKLGLTCQGDYNSAELCNGVDDDCNGQTDETFNLGQACDGIDGDKCKNGVWTCRTDGTTAQCLESIFNVTERCNGIDDDCDGFTDEEWALGQPCDGSDADACANGTYSCNAAMTGVECVNEPGTYAAGSEICDNQDNDCDGSVDETWPTRNQKCDSVEDTDTCATGINRCNGTMNGTQCIGDSACATGATCTSSGKTYIADKCLCGSSPVLCTKEIASECNVSGQCLCGTGPACTGATQCLTDGQGGYSCR